MAVASLALATLGATRGFETMTPTVVIDRIGMVGLQAVLVGAAVVASTRVQVVALSWAVPIVLSLVASAWWLTRLCRTHDGRVVETTGPAPSTWEVARDFWAFTLPRSVASIFNVVVQWLDVLLVGAMISPGAAGIYAAATRLISFGLMVARSVGDMTQPMIGRLLASGDDGGARALYGIATAWQMVLTWPFYILVAGFAATLLGLLGPDFTTGTSVVVILALSGMVGAAAGPVDMVLLMAGKSMWSLWNTGLSLGINLVLNLLLIPSLGIRGAALAWATSRVVGNLVPLVQTTTALGLHPFGKAWAWAALLSTTLFGATTMVVRALQDQPSLEVVVIAGLVASAAFVGLLHRKRDVLDLDVVMAAVRSRLARGRSRSAARRFTDHAVGDSCAHVTVEPGGGLT